MTSALFRLRTPDGEVRLARGTVGAGPLELLPASATLDALLSSTAAEFARSLRQLPSDGDVPLRASILPPVESQEVWAAGVTYSRSRDARVTESAADGTVYDRVYEARRPELFFKAAGWRVRGVDEPLAIRSDSAWNVPEAELGLVLAPDMSIAGYTVGNDVSSRSIESENPLYLPQAKVYDGACALGPAIVPVDAVAGPFDIDVEVTRDGEVVYADSTSTMRLRRDFGTLTEYLGRALTFPCGAILLTGTGSVPPDRFTLRPGDTVRIVVEALGELRNPIELVGSDDVSPRAPTVVDVTQAVGPSDPIDGGG